MKVALKLVRNGNATQVTIPRRVLDFMRWRAGDAMILEITGPTTITVHPPGPTDYRTAGNIGVIDNTLPEAAK